MDRGYQQPRKVGAAPQAQSDIASRPPTVASAPQNRASAANAEPKKGVVQPKPQALPNRQGPSAILVSPRQKGNPILNSVRSMPWEYSDIPADFVLGATTCALFLSLKYHRLHPEYIYGRIRALQGKYNLRILLTMVDVQNHEESLKELSKTSLINNVTLILCWRAEEAGRYLELYKTYEFTAPTGIRAHQATSYSDRLVEFVTTPRGINKTDAVSLVSNFGSIRTAVNAQPEEIAMISGWGEKKVERWCRAVRDPFRIKRAGKRSLMRKDTEAEDSLVGEQSRPTESGDVSGGLLERVGPEITPEHTMPEPSISAKGPDADQRPEERAAELVAGEEIEEDDDDALFVPQPKVAPPAQTTSMAPPGTLNASKPNPKKRAAEPEVSDGVMAALAKLRHN